MTTTTDFDRLARRWLEDGPTELADGVLGSALDEVHRTHQRRAIRAPWRVFSMSFHPTMTTGRVAAAILVAAVALGGTAWALRQSPAAVQPTASPNATASLLPSARPPATPGVSVSGWIVGADGAPYGSVLTRHVKVLAKPVGANGDGIEAQAGADGRFTFQLTPGTWDLWVTVVQGRNGTYGVILDTIDVGATPVSGVRLVYEQSTWRQARLSGRVTDASGKPVPATVTLHLGASIDDGTIVQTFDTDADGRWATWIQPGVAYCLAAQIGSTDGKPTSPLGTTEWWRLLFGPTGIARDLASWRCAVVPDLIDATPIPMTVDLRLPPVVTVRGTVVDATGLALGTATPGLTGMWLYAGTDEFGAASTRIGALDGSFSIALFSGQWELTVLYSVDRVGHYEGPHSLTVDMPMSGLQLQVPEAWSPSPAPTP